MRIQLGRAAGQVDAAHAGAGGEEIDHRIDGLGGHLLGALRAGIDVAVQAALVAAVAEVELQGLDPRAACRAGNRCWLEAGAGWRACTIETCRMPVIAMIEGGVWGGAVETVLACDIIIAAPDATFAVTPARLGVPYNVSGMMTFMSAASLRLVKELAFTAAPMSAARAERIGMINHVVAAEHLEIFTLEMATTIAGNAPLSIAVMKEQLRVLAGAKPVSPRGFEKVQGLRRIVYDSHDYKEGIRAFKEKRKPVFAGK
jgi:enoyl-CoA hydratase/carnithine racemase